MPQLGDLFAAQLLPVLGLFAVNLITAVTLGPTGKGVATFMVSTASLGAVVLFGSLHVGATQAVRRGDRSGALRCLGTSTAIALLPLGLCAWIVFATRLPAPAFLARTDEALTLAGLSAAVCSLVTFRTIQGIGRARTYRRLVFVQTAVYVGLVIVGAVAGLTPRYVVAAWLAGQVVGLLLATKEVRGVLAEVPKRGSERSPSAIGASLAAHVGAIGMQVLYRADLVALGFFSGARQVGLYAVAVALAEVVWIVAEALSLSTFSEGVNLAAGGEGRGLRQHLQACRRIGIVVACGVLLVSWVGLTAVLVAYKQSFPILLLLLPGVWWGGQTRIVMSALTAADRRRTVRRAGAAAALAALAYLPAVAVAGAKGAAVASTLLYVLQYYYVRRAAGTENQVAWGGCETRTSVASTS